MINPEFKTEREEGQPQKFVYVDYNKNREVIFECVAKSINEADAAYQEKTGQNPSKQNHVGCYMEKIEKN